VSTIDNAALELERAAAHSRRVEVPHVEDMSQELKKANAYRIYSQKLRDVAQNATQDNVRESVTNLADEYEGMARTMEAIDATRKAMARFNDRVSRVTSSLPESSHD
jgi:type I restriction-modification system DNA methylase subunit